MDRPRLVKRVAVNKHREVYADDAALLCWWRDYERTGDIFHLIAMIGCADFYGHNDIREKTQTTLMDKLGKKASRHEKEVDDSWFSKFYDYYRSALPEASKEEIYRRIANEFVDSVTPELVKKRLQRLGKVPG